MKIDYSQEKWYNMMTKEASRGGITKDPQPCTLLPQIWMQECQGKDNNLKKKYFLLNWSKKVTKNQTKHKPKINLLCFSPFAKMEQKVNLKEEVTRQ
jgi:hypothetical protein